MTSTTTSNEELDSFVTGMKSRYGLDLSPYQPGFLKKRLESILISANISSVFSLWGKILKDRTIAESTIEKILTTEQYFFDPPALYKRLRNDLLFKLRRQPQINVWCESCGTGEALYSAVILFEEGRLGAKTRYLATDSNEKLLKKAKRGVFPPNGWNKLLNNYLAYNSLGKPINHFSHQKNFRLLNTYNDKVSFKVCNVLTEDINQQFDIIFCRNQMDRLKDNHKQNLLKKLHDRLNPNGYLILGTGDSLPHQSPSLFEEYDESLKIYKKI